MITICSSSIDQFWKIGEGVHHHMRTFIICVRPSWSTLQIRKGVILGLVVLWGLFQKRVPFFARGGRHTLLILRYDDNCFTFQNIVGVATCRYPCYLCSSPPLLLPPQLRLTHRARVSEQKRQLIQQIMFNYDKERRLLQNKYKLYTNYMKMYTNCSRMWHLYKNVYKLYKLVQTAVQTATKTYTNCTNCMNQ